MKMDVDKSDEISANPWRLCTVTQVEEVNAKIQLHKCNEIYLHVLGFMTR